MTISAVIGWVSKGSSRRDKKHTPLAVGGQVRDRGEKGHIVKVGLVGRGSDDVAIVPKCF